MTDLKMVYKRFCDEVINQGDVEAMDRFVAQDVIDSGHAGFGSGRDALTAFIRGLHDGFPDIRMDISWLVQEHNRLAVWAPMHGTHTGPSSASPLRGPR